MKENDSKSDAAQLAAQLAPPEELSKHAAGEFAAIVVDADDINLSQDIMEKPAEKTFLGMEPVVLVILCIMLTFIAFIAWQISRMPVE